MKKSDIKVVYLEHKKMGTKEYTYLCKNVRLGSNRWKKLRKYVGIKDPYIHINTVYFKHSTYFVENELKLLKEMYSDEKEIVISDEILKKGIEIENYLSLNLDKKKEFEIEFAKEFIYNSNKMEGSTLPKKEFLAIFNKRQVHYEDENEILEAKNSILAWDFLRTSFTFNVASVKKLYSILTKDLLMLGKYKYPKGFKIVPNTIGKKETCPPNKVKGEMLQLMNWYKSNKKRMNSLILAFEFYYKYEKIHPFQDGNGRTGRMIMNKILMSNSFPPIVIFDEDKINQYIAFDYYDNGDKKKFYRFLIDQTSKTYEHIYKEIFEKK